MTVKYLVVGNTQMADHWRREREREIGRRLPRREVAATSTGSVALRGLPWAPVLIETGYAPLTDRDREALDVHRRLAAILGESELADFEPGGRRWNG